MNDAPQHRVAWWIATATIVVGVLGGVAVTMGWYSHNEEMYISAGFLVSTGSVPYRDFAYLQTPYLPWIYGALFWLLPHAGWYLFTAKCVSVAAWVTSGVLVTQISRQVTGSSTVALLIAGVFFTHVTILLPAAESSNYVLPIALVLGAIRAFQVAPHRPFLPGILLGVAVGCKLTVAPVLLPFLVACVCQRWAQAFPLVGGAAIGLTPLALHLAAGVDVVYFNNVGFHLLNALWWGDQGGAVTMIQKIRFAGSILVHDASNIWLTLALLAGIAVSWRPVVSTDVRLIGGAFLVSLVAAIAPTPSYSQYFALPAAMAIVLLGHAWKRPASGGRVPTLLVLIVAGTCLTSVWRTWPAVTALGNRHSWVAWQMRDAGQQLRQAIDAQGGLEGRPIATLRPVLALEAGLPIYRELATGTFAFWIGDRLTEAQRRRYVTTSETSLTTLLDETPPAAVVVGFSKYLDDPFRAYATMRGYAGPFPLTGGGDYYLAPGRTPSVR